jgi:hypothetical protein
MLRELSDDSIKGWFDLWRYTENIFAVDRQNADTLHFSERVGMFCRFLERVFGVGELFKTEFTAQDVDLFVRCAIVVFGSPGSLLSRIDTETAITAMETGHFGLDKT